ncbi:MAG: M23 family metallopeptidase, partial [Candidatus Aminicenantales bacterium]
LGLAAQSRESLRTESGVVVEMAYRFLEPGEPLLFTLKSPGVSAVIVHFLGKTAVVRTKPVSGRAPMGFLGIDLDVKPGPYPLDMQVEKEDGSLDRFRREILVKGRTFPFVKLRISPEFVTPPKSVLVRIQRESEIVSLVFESGTAAWLGDGGFTAPHPVKPYPNFGQRRLTNNVVSSVHAGVDLPVPWGEPIRAVNRGRVVLASSLYLSGGTVIIDHGLGVFSYYCHLSKLLVRRGDAIEKGAVLGKCGSTGRSTGPHLHWSMRVSDSRVDPYALLELPVEGGSPPGGNFFCCAPYLFKIRLSAGHEH